MLNFSNHTENSTKTRWSKFFQYVYMKLALVLICLFPHIALADTSPSIDPALCRSLVKHVPDASVAYQPGVDVDGNPVAPADLPGAPQMQLPDKINIPLTLSLAKVLKLNTSQYPYNQLGPGTEAQLGTITVEGDKVLFNGKPLSDEQQDNLAVLCLKRDDQ